MALDTYEESDARSAFRRFVAARRHALLRTSYLTVGDHDIAERVLGRALARAWRDWRRAEVSGDATAYVQRQIFDLAAARRSRPADLEESAGVPEQPPAAEQFADAGSGMDESDRIWSNLAGLPPRARGVLVLCCYEGMSVDEIGHLLGRSPDWVNGHVVNGLTRLARALGVPPEEITTDPGPDLDDLDDLDDSDELFRRWSP